MLLNMSTPTWVLFTSVLVYKNYICKLIKEIIQTNKLKKKYFIEYMHIGMNLFENVILTLDIEE